MQNFRDSWKIRIARILTEMLKNAGIDGIVEPSQVTAEQPPKPEYGDLGFPMFGFAKLFRKGPPWIAQTAAAALAGEDAACGPAEREASGAFTAEGPYLNVRLDRGAAAAAILGSVLEDPAFGRPATLTGSRIMVEFSSPNTNKPLHLGHLRNDVLGESISRILAACGAEVRKVCIINDRGIHICKSMLAYQEHGGDKTPESEGVKSDHFVGEWYVRFNRDLKAELEALKDKGLSAKEADVEAPLQKRSQQMLRLWEAGDPEIVALWKKMNAWTVEGMKETYRRTGISFDQYYFESQTYLLGKEEILNGLEQGLFYKAEDGAVMVDLTMEKLDKKVLLRSDGTSIYITQDIGLAINRNRDWPFDRLIYVVGSEQQYHFQVLFAVLKKLGFERAGNLYHLSYGMVNLPEGKMKSREGTVVDADDLIDSLREDALMEIREREREDVIADPKEVAEKVALGALHYYLLQVNPQKDMLFDPRESLSFNGNTGPYLQYMGARISSMLRKAAASRDAGGFTAGAPRTQGLLSGDAEWELLKTLAVYPEAVADAAARTDPSVLAVYLYDLSKAFSRFYHDCPILNAPEAELSAARLALSRGVLRVLKDAMTLICVPFLEIM
ncbi:MAG: arginine--tRNA ligase [Spirochaetaceae bacterium]|jgi:arginyl-tRNA synthetase|nr:arginine--tRNA ligase [Spirochaetaceae bacterium]